MFGLWRAQPDIVEKPALIAPAMRHCLACEVAWRWEPECWSCGGQGVVGELPFTAQLMPSIPPTTFSVEPAPTEM